MIKNIVKLESIVADRQIQLLCDNDCPINVVKEALFQFLKYIGQIEDQAKDSMPKQENVSVPEVKEEVKETS